MNYKNTTKALTMLMMASFIASSHSILNVNASFKRVESQEIVNIKPFIHQPTPTIEPLVEELNEDLTFSNLDYIPVLEEGLIDCPENAYFSLIDGCSCKADYIESEEGNCFKPIIKKDIPIPANQPSTSQTDLITETTADDLGAQVQSINEPITNEQAWTDPASIPSVASQTYEEPVAYQEASVGNSQVIVDTALGLVGSTGLDCYAVVRKALDASGWTANYDAGTQVGLDSLSPGDIIVYPSHYSVYVGNGQAVHGGYDGLNVILGDIVVGKQPYTAYRCY